MSKLKPIEWDVQCCSSSWNCIAVLASYHKPMSDTIGGDQLVLTGHKGRHDFYSVHKEARFQSATARGFVKSQTVKRPFGATQRGCQNGLASKSTQPTTCSMHLVPNR